ncbi:hypothetical protein BDF20DRAFT_490991 [Mycotypha africana]|uniref:uncharacterized protein n=1 Tax=Mycotypha africana TaxID=64632 RepID=UPI002300C26E|nr:uncharacterized protein BDF20DRAFT_490991 [Mycotypha africana]KAI8979264.1 hypothetical protein BDF20DRAFT_490991 [Mycotypha africana]
MAKANNNDELGIAVKSLIHDWKMMHNRSNEDDQCEYEKPDICYFIVIILNFASFNSAPSPTEATPTILKEPSTTASHTNALVISKEPPSTAETSKITLAISKEPPPLQQSGFTSTATKKPRAIVDYNFLSSMAGNKAAGSSTVKFNNSNGNSTTTVRPDTRSFDIGNLVESLSGKNKGKNIVNTTSLQSKRNSDYLSDPNLYQDTQPKKIRKLTKRVQFKSNLTDVRYFTRDMDEWNALVSLPLVQIFVCASVCAMPDFLRF